MKQDNIYDILRWNKMWEEFIHFCEEFENFERRLGFRWSCLVQIRFFWWRNKSMRKAPSKLQPASPPKNFDAVYFHMSFLRSKAYQRPISRKNIHKNTFTNLYSQKLTMLAAPPTNFHIFSQPTQTSGAP